MSITFNLLRFLIFPIALVIIVIIAVVLAGIVLTEALYKLNTLYWGVRFEINKNNERQ